MDASRMWTARPDFLPIAEDFLEAMRGNFSLPLRDWRLITFVAAKQVPSTYCSLVYGRQLVADLGSKDMVLAVRRDFRNVGLSARDVEMLAYAETIAGDASKVDQAQIDRLRAEGFSDVQIADIALCASFRCFLARYADAVGATPEPDFLDADDTFNEAMMVGRKPASA
jgi:alkylhydroperoxidase family enzyme